MHHLQFHLTQSARERWWDTTLHGTYHDWKLERMHGNKDSKSMLCKTKKENACIVISTSKTCSPGFQWSNNQKSKYAWLRVVRMRSSSHMFIQANIA